MWDHVNIKRVLSVLYSTVRQCHFEALVLIYISILFILKAPLWTVGNVNVNLMSVVMMLLIYFQNFTEKINGRVFIHNKNANAECHVLRCETLNQAGGLSKGIFELFKHMENPFCLSAAESFYSELWAVKQVWIQ